MVQTFSGLLRRNGRHLRRAPEDEDIRAVTLVCEPPVATTADSDGAEPEKPPDPPDVEHSPVRTRSGREIRLPQRFQ